MRSGFRLTFRRVLVFFLFPRRPPSPPSSSRLSPELLRSRAKRRRRGRGLLVVAGSRGRVVWNKSRHVLSALRPLSRCIVLLSPALCREGSLTLCRSSPHSARLLARALRLANHEPEEPRAVLNECSARNDGSAVSSIVCRVGARQCHSTHEPAWRCAGVRFRGCFSTRADGALTLKFATLCSLWKLRFERTEVRPRALKRNPAHGSVNRPPQLCKEAGTQRQFRERRAHQDLCSVKHRHTIL